MSYLAKLKAFMSYLAKFQSHNSTEEHMKLKTSLLELQGCVHRLEKENEALKKRLGAKGSFSRDNGVYSFETSHGHEELFCSRCWDVDCKLVRLHVGDDGVATCPQCKNSFSQVR